MTFLAQDDGSGERNLFRCVVCELEDEVWLCEIKDVGEISLLVDHVEEYFQKVAERVEDLPSSARKDDLVDGYAAGSGVILVSPTMFRVMGEKSLSDLHKMCDDYMDPCLSEKCGMMTGVYVGGFEWVSKYAKLAIDIYNQKEQKNFDLIKVERLYMISYAYYCMTFWVRNGKSDKCRLFRALVCFKGDAEEIFKGYVQDDDEFTVSGELDDASIQELYESDEDLPPYTCKMKRGASTIDGYDGFTVETQSSIRLSDTSRGDNFRGGYHKKQHELAQERSRPSDSLDSMSNKRKKSKKDALVEVVGMIATSFQEFVASKKKEEKSSGIEIHEVVSSITGLTTTQRFKAVEKLMDGDVERFRLLKALLDEEKRE